jgi:hypothetical protein
MARAKESSKAIFPQPMAQTGRRISVICAPMLKKVFIALFIVLLCAGNFGLSQLGRFSMTFVKSWDSRFSNTLATSCPLNDAEEKSGKSTITFNQSEEDSEWFSFKWTSKRLSGNSDLSGQQSSTLFKSIDREILVPPPKA